MESIKNLWEPEASSVASREEIPAFSQIPRRGAVNQGKPGDSRAFPSSTPEDKCHGGGGGREREREREEDARPVLVAVNQGFGDIKRPLIRENTRFISAERRRDRQEIGVYMGGQSMGRDEYGIKWKKKDLGYPGGEKGGRGREGEERERGESIRK